MKKLFLILSVFFCCNLFYGVSLSASSLKQVNAYLKNEQYQRALSILNKLDNHFYLKGICYLNTFEYKSALYNFLQAIIYEKKKECYYYIGVCYYKLQDFKNAERYFKKSIELNVKKNESIFFTGLSEYYIGNYSNAIIYFNMVVSRYTNEAKYFRALCEIRLGKKKKAVMLLLKILKNNPESYLQDNIYNKLRQISENRLYLTAYSSLSYDSNVLREPESSTSKSSDKGDLFNEIYLNLREKFSFTETFDINPEISFYKSNYKQLNDYNLKGFSIGPNFEFFTERFMFYIKPYFEDYELGDKNYENNFKILSEIYINNFKENYLNLKILSGREDFKKFNEKDCYFFTLYINQLLKFGRNINKFGLYFGTEDADGKNYSFKKIGVKEGITAYVENYVCFKANISYEYRNYSTSKWEQTLTTSVNLTYTKIKFIEIGVDLKFLKNFSNDSMYDYSLTQSTLFVAFNY